ncbi:MAG: hypothetical protein KDD60_12190, partial [Bdellovibrionales bacterium]|nr:hypothetical protein [Bdellovibrionales bacterium]
MDINKFTQKSQEVLAASQSKAATLGHQQVDADHLFISLINQSDGTYRRVLEKIGINVQQLSEKAQELLSKKPSVTGPGAESGQIYISQQLGKLLAHAEEEAKRLKDDFVSVEHLGLAMFEHGSKQVITLLQSFQLTKDRFLEALTSVRGNQRVTSANPEATYEALERYGRDLVEEARKGKLDPVIGR